MRDERLEQLARDYKKLQTEIKDLESEADGIKRKLVAEMERRKSKGVEFQAGVRITLVKPEEVYYDPDRLREAIGARVWQRVTNRVIDKDKLAAAVQEGKVDIHDVDNASLTRNKAAYPLVTIK